MSKIQVTQIAQWVPIEGHSYIFPVGTTVFMQRLAVDVDKGVGTYQGLVLRGTCVIEVQFDRDTLELKGYPSSPGITLNAHAAHVWSI